MSPKAPAAPAPSLSDIRHSLAHLLASAVLEMMPEAKLGVGPVIDTGFYYDFELPRPLVPEDLPILQEKMQRLVKEGHAFERQPVQAGEAMDFFTAAGQPFKVELIRDLTEHGTTVFKEISGGAEEPKGPVEITLYKTGAFVDLCRGGHVEKTNQVQPGSFKLTTIAGAYWRGNEKNPQLTRIYGAAFATKAELDAYLAMLEEAKKRDHKVLGPQLDLFVFSDLVGSGLPLWTPKGTVIRHVLDEFVWSLRKKRDYVRVEIPHITKRALYEKSGHWEKYKDDLFKIVTREGHEYAMKPMNCPHHTQIYDRKKWSYRELPQRYANTTMVYRDEQSGELAGLSRVLSITQDDAHVFCRSVQVRDEMLKIWDIVEELYGAVEIPLTVRLSFHDPAHPESYLGTPELWKSAEDQIREVAKAKGVDAVEKVGEAAFYGPKLDFIGRDSLGREWQVATIQLDMNLPERFNLTCVAEDGSDERIVMIHAAIMGSIERFMSIMIEHFSGAFPLWMAPVQVKILPISDKVFGFCEEVRDELLAAGLRVEADWRNESLGRKIRDAEMEKAPHMLVIGEKEAEAKMVTLRRLHQKEQVQFSVADYVAMALDAIAKKTR